MGGLLERIAFDGLTRDGAFSSTGLSLPATAFIATLDTVQLKASTS